MGRGPPSVLLDRGEAGRRAVRKQSEPPGATDGSQNGKRMNVQNSAGAECTSATAGREGVSRAR
jgi:hypothetical protein